MSAADQPLHERLGCFGYHGFGSGYALAAYGPASDTRELYCGKCPLARACWQAHRERTKRGFPSLCEVSDKAFEGRNGDEGLREFLEQTGQTRDAFTEPYSTAMIGNFQDGTARASGQPFADRGAMTLTWPLLPLGGDGP